MEHIGKAAAALTKRILLIEERHDGVKKMSKSSILKLKHKHPTTRDENNLLWQENLIGKMVFQVLEGSIMLLQESKSKDDGILNADLYPRGIFPKSEFKSYYDNRMNL